MIKREKEIRHKDRENILQYSVERGSTSRLAREIFKRGFFFDSCRNEEIVVREDEDYFTWVEAVRRDLLILSPVVCPMINLSLKNFFRCTEFDVSWGATAFVSDVHEERNCYKFEWQGASLNSVLKRKDGKIGIIIKEIIIVINIILNTLRLILGACIINPCWISDFISIISLCLLKYLRDCFPFRDRWNASVTFF